MDLTFQYLAYLVIIAKVKIVKEVISCDVSPVAMFYSHIILLILGEQCAIPS